MIYDDAIITTGGLLEKNTKARIRINGTLSAGFLYLLGL